ncbi:MAG: hypothetical protein H0W46_03505, partial [Acidimicrobiia bacterium]|nr:hypothetical protein [Acidimicrobiia bacterium]
MASSPLPPPDASSRAVPVAGASPNAPIDDAVDGVDGRHPRYGLRRAVVAGGLVAVVAAGVAAAVALTSGDSGDGGGAGAAPGWSRLVAIDPEDAGAVTVIDGDGDIDETLDLGIEITGLRAASGDTLIVGGDEEAAVADLGSRDVRVVALPEDAVLRRVGGTRRLVVVAADPAGGPAVLITATGDVDVNDAAQFDDGRYLVDQLTSDPPGDAVLASELTTFQTVLVPLDGGEPTFFAGAGVALTARDVVTVVRAGPDADVVITPRDGGEERRITTTGLRGVAARADGGLVLVSEDGRVATVDREADDAEDGPTIELAAGAEIETVIPYPSIDRVLVEDGTGLHLLDATDGSVVATVDGGLALGAATSGDPAQRCAALVTTAGLGTLDLIAGEVSAAALDDLDRPTGASVDGCTLVGQT